MSSQLGTSTRFSARRSDEPKEGLDLRSTNQPPPRGLQHKTKKLPRAVRFRPRGLTYRERQVTQYPGTLDTRSWEPDMFRQVVPRSGH
jgi:hypothetical protein